MFTTYCNRDLRSIDGMSNNIDKVLSTPSIAIEGFASEADVRECLVSTHSRYSSDCVNSDPLIPNQSIARTHRQSRGLR